MAVQSLVLLLFRHNRVDFLAELLFLDLAYVRVRQVGADLKTLGELELRELAVEEGDYLFERNRLVGVSKGNEEAGLLP